MRRKQTFKVPPPNNVTFKQSTTTDVYGSSNSPKRATNRLSILGDNQLLNSSFSAKHNSQFDNLTQAIYGLTQTTKKASLKIELTKMDIVSEYHTHQQSSVLKASDSMDKMSDSISESGQSFFNSQQHRKKSSIKVVRELTLEEKKQMLTVHIKGLKTGEE